MTKKVYMKPAMQVVELQQRCQILAGSSSVTGVNPNLQPEEVNDGW